MKDCQSIQALFSEYLDQRLDREEVSLVEKHLSSCSVCKAELDKLRNLSQILKSLDKDIPPADFLERVNRRIKETKSMDSFLSSLFKKPLVKVALPQYLILFIVILGAAMGIGHYLYRGIQGRMQIIGDQMGDQYSPGLAHRQGRKQTMLAGFQRVPGFSRQWDGTSGSKTTTNQVSQRTFTENFENKSTPYTYNESMSANYESTSGNRREEQPTVTEKVVTINVYNSAEALEKVKKILKQLGIGNISILGEKEGEPKSMVLNIEVPEEKIRILMKELYKLSADKTKFSISQKPKDGYIGLDIVLREVETTQFGVSATMSTESYKSATTK